MAKTKYTPLKDRIKKQINICGRKFELEFKKGNIGGEFNTIHPSTGMGKIIVGDEPKDEFYQLNNILHEIIEAILTLREHRWREDDSHMLFSMTHESFAQACLDITRALIDAGLFPVKEAGDRE